uniref:Translation elongation factor EFTu/EF1A C-terminal domain-containing protein n=1 Tax=Neolamprologus brichardi TaxID=32507 RepID=A0A3Q4GU79_NEOBR
MESVVHYTKNSLCLCVCVSVGCVGRVRGWWWVQLMRAVFCDELRTGERAVVRFRFIKHPEYLRLGAKLLFREGVTKGIGHVTCLLPPSQNHNQNHDQNLQDY